MTKSQIPVLTIAISASKTHVVRLCRFNPRLLFKMFYRPYETPFLVLQSIKTEFPLYSVYERISQIVKLVLCLTFETPTILVSKNHSLKKLKNVAEIFVFHHLKLDRPMLIYARRINGVKTL